MASINKTTRVRIFLDLLQDGQVSDATPYQSVDMVPAPIAIEYGTEYWAAYGTQLYEEDGTPRDPTNGEMANLLINTIRNHLRSIKRTNRIKAARESAAASESAIVDPEIDGEIGTNENE